MLTVRSILGQCSIERTRFISTNFPIKVATSTFHLIFPATFLFASWPASYDTIPLAQDIAARRYRTFRSQRQSLVYRQYPIYIGRRRRRGRLQRYRRLNKQDVNSPCRASSRKQVIRRVVAGVDALNSRFSYWSRRFLSVLPGPFSSPLRNPVHSRLSSSGRELPSLRSQPPGFASCMRARTCTRLLVRRVHVRIHKFRFCTADLSCLCAAALLEFEWGCT